MTELPKCGWCGEVKLPDAEEWYEFKGEVFCCDDHMFKKCKAGIAETFNVKKGQTGGNKYEGHTFEILETHISALMKKIYVDVRCKTCGLTGRIDGDIVHKVVPCEEKT